MSSAWSRRWCSAGPAVRRIHETYSLTGMVRQSGQELVRRDGQVPDALARRVEDGAGDRCRRPHEADLPQSFGPERIHDVVLFVDEDHLDIAHIGVHGQVILREVE